MTVTQNACNWDVCFCYCFDAALDSKCTPLALITMLIPTSAGLWSVCVECG